MRALVRADTLVSKRITGYQVVCQALWRKQHHKCCYCENKCQPTYNDVEHYRPKAHADRSPGSADTHGYWWLAFTWKNLLFACSTCNRAGKNDRFPLTRGDTALAPEKHPPGDERPLLLDPGADNPVAHIQFVRTNPGPHWYARPRGNHPRGIHTIEICKLNRAELLEMRDSHVDRVVQPHADELLSSLTAADRPRIQRAYRRARGLLAPVSPCSALSYDALRHLVPSPQLSPWNLSWPEPADMARRVALRVAGAGLPW